MYKFTNTSRPGKGAALIIPNHLRRPHSAVVVDPKGENAEKIWEVHKAVGQNIYVLDPFRSANVSTEFAESF